MPQFTKPTIEQLAEYAASIGYRDFDAGKFYDHYETIGWRVGKTGLAMKCWRAAVRTWQRNSKLFDAPTRPLPAGDRETPLQRQARLDAIDRRLIAEYADKIAACRSWRDRADAAPMGDPVDAEKRLWTKISDNHNPRFVARLKHHLK